MSGAPAAARTFVALSLDRELGRAVATRAAATLDAQIFRAVRREGLHVTLAFLGPLARARLVPLGRSLRAALAECVEPQLWLGGTGAFPDLERAQVLWGAVEERGAAGALAQCRAAVRAGLAGVGLDLVAPEAERFHPHLTLARPRARRACVPEAFRELCFELPWSPRAVELLESRAAPEGSRYVLHGRFPLLEPG